MKKFMSVALILLLVTAVFAGCSGDLSRSQKAKLKSELEYYNEKALANIDSLLYTSFEHAEEWIQETFTEDELSYWQTVSDENNLGYVTPSRNVLILFKEVDGRADFIIEPYLEDLSLVEWCSSDDLEKVNEYSERIGTSIGNVPHYGVLAIYGFDKSPELRFWYNTGEQNSAHLDFVYDTGRFTLVDRD